MQSNKDVISLDLKEPLVSNPEIKSGWSNKKKAGVGILALLLAGGAAAAIGATVSKSHTSTGGDTPTPNPDSSTGSAYPGTSTGSGPNPAPSISYCAGYDWGDEDPWINYLPIGINNTQSNPLIIYSYNFTSNINNRFNPPYAWCPMYAMFTAGCAIQKDSTVTMIQQGNSFLYQVRANSSNPISIPPRTTGWVVTDSATDLPVARATNLNMETDQGLIQPVYTGNCTYSNSAQPRNNMEKQQLAKLKHEEAQQKKKMTRAVKKEIAKQAKHQLSQGPSFFSNPARWLADHIPGFGSAVDHAVSAAGKNKKK